MTNEYMIPDSNGQVELASGGTFPAFGGASTGPIYASVVYTGGQENTVSGGNSGASSGSAVERMQAALEAGRPAAGEMSAGERDRLMSEKIALETGYSNNYTDPTARVGEINQKLGLASNHRTYSGRV